MSDTETLAAFDKELKADWEKMQTAIRANAMVGSRIVKMAEIEKIAGHLRKQSDALGGEVFQKSTHWFLVKSE